MVYAVERLAQRVREEGLEVICVPSSFQAKQLIIQHGLKLGDLEMHPQVYQTIFIQTCNHTIVNNVFYFSVKSNN